MKDITPSEPKASSVHPLTAAREAQDPPLTREGLAFKAGVSFKAIERFESGRTRRPHRATLKAIAEALGVDDPDQLVPAEDAA